MIHNPLIFVLPPLLGALIGYVTNALAIKMLFRPLKEIRIFGIRVPFTPGILPRQRHLLAENIGRTVERELITEQTIRNRLEQDDLESMLLSSVSQYSAVLLHTGLNELPPEAIKKLGLLLYNVTGSEALVVLLSKLINSFVFSLGNKTLAELLQLDKDKLEEKLTEILSGILKSGRENISAKLEQGLEHIYPELSTAIIDFLKKPATRTVLESQGRVFLGNAILKLNVFQRLFLSAAQYDRTLHERIPEIIDDLIKQIDIVLRDKKNSEQLCTALHKNILSFVYRQNSMRMMSALLAESMEHILNEPLSKVLGNILNLQEQELGGKTAKKIQAYLSALKPEQIEQGIQKFLDNNGSTRLYSLLNLDEEKKRALDSYISSYFLRIAREKIPLALKTLDIRKLVSERINSLDMLDVEKIVLDVLANQLRWINVFGALLGALIGFSQVFINLYLN